MLRWAMVRELWGTFPRLIEKNINGLLERALPNRSKAFQLYKTCQHEQLWSGTYEAFSRHLEEFFSRPASVRRKSDFDVFLSQPMHSVVYADFHLNFRTAVVDESAITTLASWAHHLLRVSQRAAEAVISVDVLTQTLKRITNPLPFEKAQNIEFEDFCAAWKATVFRCFGQRHDGELQKILTELNWINTQLKEEEKDPARVTPFPTLHYSKPESEWVRAVRQAAVEHKLLPPYPHAKEPQKQSLRDLQRVILLFELVQTTQLPELLKHRSSVHATLLDRCDRLLADSGQDNQTEDVEISKQLRHRDS